MACIDGKEINIPEPGSADIVNLRFYEEKDRALFLAMVGNTQLKMPSNIEPRVAIVGLSPGDTQLKQFIRQYNRTGNYEEAALLSAFEGLQSDLIRMMNGLGVSKHIGLNTLPENTDLNRCGLFLTTSLVKCASLTLTGNSSDFSPWHYQSNVKCITNRFVREMLSDQNGGITHILVLGNKAKKAVKDRIRIGRITIHEYLERHGKKLAYMPHPSGANRESVELAVLDAKLFPSREEHQNRMWQKYKVSQMQKGGRLADELSYKRTRASRWQAINEIREIFRV